MSGPSSAPPELPGFTYQRAIGHGGFADVFLYLQERPSRNVAVKVLKPSHVTAAGLRQFEAEADLMAEVSTHPNIVTIFDAGTAPDGRPYIVMEHYPGPHFGLRCRDGRLSIAEVLHVGIQVCSAVETAHRAGILHRDVKPANVLTSAYGRPGLTDFGIAAVQRGGTVERASGVSIGFTAPEVVEDTDAGSRASDVFSLGATVYSLVAGHSPFWVAGGENTTASTTARVVSGKTTELKRQDAPRSLGRLVEQALSLDPTQRPATALQLARALQDIEQQLQLPTTAIDVHSDDGEPTSDWRDRRTDDDPDEGTRFGGARVVDAQPRAPSPLVTGGSVGARSAAPPGLVQAVPGALASPDVASSPVVPPRPGPAAGTAPGGTSPSNQALTYPPTAGSSDLRFSPASAYSDLAAGANDTVLRGVPATPVTAAPGPAEGEPPKSRTKVAMAISAGVLVVAVIAIVLLTVTGGSKGSSPRTSTVDATAPPEQPVVVSPDPPSDLAAAVDAAGSVTVTWSVDDAQPGDTYRVLRMDSGHVGEVLATVSATKATATVAAGSTPCVTVIAIRGGVQSTPTPPAVCAAHSSAAPGAP